MKRVTEDFRDRFYKEVGISLTRAGYTVRPMEHGLLPLEWNVASLCRITAGGGAQYRAEELEPDGAADAFHRATEIAHTTAEYMRHLTGDTHGNFVRIDGFCRRMKTKKTDTMIILGNAGFNYYLGNKDTRAKEYAASFPITLFCIHGNHEARPQTISTYIESEYCGGKVLYEEAFPCILFAVD